ncbi:MAG: hypothetical protein IPM54_05945 [Polyangiaceae bacterium]|nr:hypothetical protein [Polyangiaceae bacterium]
MKDELLREATRALREEADGSPGKQAETRARIVRTLKERRARKLAAIRVFVPIAAVLVGSVAWASATHRLPGVWYELKDNLGFGRAEVEEAPVDVPADPPAPRRVAKALDVKAPEPAAEVVEAPAPTDVEPAPQPEDVEGQAAAAPKMAAAAPPRIVAPTDVPKVDAAPADVPKVDAAAAAPEVRVDPAEALYRAAHEAHFVTRNSSAALAAWDAYLAAAPRGRFALEARYNRALCLVRLGRKAEAQRALEPFAAGAYGGYRKAEARSLVDAMQGGAP